MKKSKLYIAGAVFTVLATGCSHELLLDADGEGSLVLNTTVNTDMKVVSRAVEDTLRENCMIWISNEKGLVRRYNKLNDVPATINLVAGHYVAEAWTGDSVPASWDKRWFKGFESFVITPGETAQVDLVCKVANVGASVRYAEGIEDVLKDFTMTIGHKIDTLVYVGREERRGYFMMPSIDKNLAFTLKGNQIDGSEFVYEGVIENAKPATEYIINVNYNQTTDEVGGAIFNIVIDEREIQINTSVSLVSAPKITGYGFDINSPVTGESGNIGRRCVYVLSATKVTEVILQSDVFRNMIATDRFNLLGMNDEGEAEVNGMGINYKYTYDASNDETIMQINFEPAFTNELENGEYEIQISATDQNQRTSNATLKFIISDAPIVAVPAAESDVSYFNATLRGLIQKENVENYGFNYRVKPNGRADDDWTFVAGKSANNGKEFTVELTNLTPNTTYQFVAVSEGFVSPDIHEFTTRNTVQLPNSSFEDWGQTGKYIFPGTDYATTFWDSGNHGSQSVGSPVTTQNKDARYIHSGTSSACLKSDYVIIKFAAGNIFAGKYLATSGTNGVLGWGRPFAETPKSVRVWARYEPATVTSRSAGTYKKTGDLDEGIIYFALVDDTKQSYNSEKWPCIVNTGTKQFFDKNGSNVIAYGEKVFTAATEGDGLVQFEIPFEYFKQGVRPSNIIFVASASRYGDYFEGAIGSTLYLDDVELVY